MPLAESNISSLSSRSLSEWQDLATIHFNELASAKKTVALFALEHGFSALHMELIIDLLIRDFKIRGVNKEYWLLWVLYATEIGYSYTGDEYWESFEARIERWEFQQREDIREVFLEFQRKYNSIVPSGSWANHFSIIALPITHAIIPKDLQFFFAKLVFSLRFRLKTMPTKSPLAVGQLLSANASMINSTRFRNFLQQEEMVGKIALSVLSEDPTGATHEFIHSRTLKRILVDLEQQHTAREWVRETRLELKPKILGAAFKNPTAKPLAHVDGSHTRSPVLKIKLKLYQTTKDKWALIAEIPNLLTSMESPYVYSFLRRTRVKIPSSKEGWFPAENLLYGSMRKRIIAWLDQPFFVFENPVGISEAGISFDGRVSKQPILFSVGSDGIATEIESKAMRPGRKYIVMAEVGNSFLEELPGVVHIECQNVVIKEIMLPEVVAQAEETILGRLGLQIQRTVRVWPVGLPARSWDGIGTTEWLTTESPCFALVHDYKVDGITVAVGDQVLPLSPKLPGDVTYFKIDPLPKGNHVLYVNVDSKMSASSNGAISLYIREPLTWTPGVSLHSGFTAFLDPNDQELNAFLDGKTDLNIFGPSDRSFSIKVDFLLGKQLLNTLYSGLIEFALSKEQLLSFRNEIRKDEYAHVCDRVRIQVLCVEVGSKEFLFARNTTPFRWLYNQENGRSYLRLIDETDDERNTILKFFDSEKPDNAQDIASRSFARKTEIDDINGLFWAQNGEYEHSIVVSKVIKTAKDFRNLSISPVLNPDMQFSILDHLMLIEIWYKADCSSMFAQTHRDKVIELLVCKLYSNLVDSSWVKSEVAFNDIPFKMALSEMTVSIKNQSMANIIRHHLENADCATLNFEDEIVWLIGTFDRCGIRGSKTLIRWAVKFVTNPLTCLSDLKTSDEGQLKQLKALPDTLKGIRLFILALSRLVEPNRNCPLLLAANFK
jgi:hypothetical protein